MTEREKSVSDDGGRERSDDDAPAPTPVLDDAPTAAQGPVVRTAALSALGLALAEHREGPLGGFWPDALRMDGGTLEIDIDRGRTSAERFAARLSSKSALRDAVYMPPEVAAGELTDLAAADVFSFAAMIYEAATGELPVGKLNAGALEAALGQRRVARVLDGLSLDPKRRPKLHDLALLVGPSSKKSAEEDGPTRGPLGTHAEDGAAARNEGRAPYPAPVAEPKSLVRTLLMVGAVSVFIGAVWFIWLAWGRLSDVPRLFLIAGFTAAVGLASEQLKKHLFDEASATLRVLFTQLFWAIGGMVLVVVGALDEPIGWAMVALLVAAVSGYVAAQRGPRTLLVAAAVLSTMLAATLVYVDLGTWGRVLLFVGLSVLARLALSMSESLRVRMEGPLGVMHILANFVGAAHASFGLLPRRTLAGVFRAVNVEEALEANLPRFIAIAVVVVVVHAVSRHYAHVVQSRALTALTCLGTALLLAPFIVVGWQVGASIFCALPPLLALGEVWRARVRADHDETALAWLFFSSSLWLTALALLADLQALTSLAVAVTGVALWALAVLLGWRTQSVLLAVAAPVHLAIAGLALGAHLSTGSVRGPTQWLAVLTVVFVVVGAGALRSSAHLRASHLFAAAFFAVFSTLFALGLITAAAGSSSDALFGAGFAYAPAGLLALLVADRTSPSRFLGALAILVLFAIPGVELVLDVRNDALSLVATGVGLLGVALGTLALTRERLAALGDTASTERFVKALVVVATATTLAPAILGVGLLLGRPLDERVAEAIRVVLPLGALYGLGMGAETLMRARVGRALQLAAALVFLGVFTLTSLVERSDYGHPALLFFGGAALLFLGVRRRHPHVVFWSAGALMLGFWTQFFMKLHTHAPTSVLLIGFGVGVLIGGVLYEKHVKALVVNVRSWPGL